MRDTVSVLDFGALGDGLTDDTTACDEAIATGKAVLWPEGHTFITQGHDLASANQRMVICGTIKLKNATNKAVFRVKAHRVQICFEGGEIHGNKANQSTTTDGLGEGIYIADGFGKCEVRDPRIHDTGRSAIAGYGNNDDCTVIGGQITDPGFMGIYPSFASNRPSKRWQISGVQIRNPGQDGIGTVGIQYAMITGNRIQLESSHFAGIALEAECNYTTVVGNTVLGTSSAGFAYQTGVQVNDSHHVSVQDNTLTTLGSGVTISGANGYSHTVTCVGNRVDDCGYSTGWAISVQTTGAGDYNYQASVLRNVVTNCPYGGIATVATSHIVITSNSIDGVNLQNSAHKRFLSGIVMLNRSYGNTIANNTISAGPRGNLKIGIHELATASGQDSGNNTIRDNRIVGADYDIICGGTAYRHSSQSAVKRLLETPLSAAPSSGHWEKGQSTRNENLEWVCDASGTFGATATTGSIERASYRLRVASTAGLYAGMKIRIAGAGPASADLDTFIAGFDGIGKTCTVRDAASTAVIGAAVTLVPPAFVAGRRF